MRAHQYTMIRWFTPTFVSTRIAIAILGITLMMGILVSERMFAQQAQWIWNSKHISGNVPMGPVHFRKRFTLEKPEIAELVIAADDEFQVYFNGELVGYGIGYDRMTKIDLTPHMIDGENVLAVRATNTQGNTGAIAAIARFRLKNEETWRWLATDPSWKCVARVDTTWKNPQYRDDRWPESQSLGAFGTTRPWDIARLQKAAAKTDARNNAAQNRPAATPQGKPQFAAQSTTAADDKSSRFTVPDNFEVQQIIDGSAGSFIAMEFNEFGQLILSREGGKLLLADFSNSESGEISVRDCCDEMENVQGILPLNGDLYVTGDGPDGMGLYRLTDADRDGMFEPVQQLAKFKGPPGEHGPHGITLGPDGMIYAIIGNASGIEGDVAENSPAKHFYEGDLLPRKEDPGGHAAGIKSPGGTILRISPDGGIREIVASGIRNSYDLAFNRSGDLFFHDSDMESDIGAPWYRPTQVFQAVAGGEYGWRSGTAKLPGYYLDTIPGIADTGRGSPTGTVVYDHVMMPVRYHGSLFLGDWSEGRILAVHLKPEKDTYQTEVETFLTAAPLTVTDVTVGPDGALYFCTGGRGTEGSVYRVVWNGVVPDEFRMLKGPVDELVKRPQPQSAWTRQELARLKNSMGDRWASTLQDILVNPKLETPHRIRALEIMRLYGPQPDQQTIIRLANDSDPAIREKAIQLISWRNEATLVPPVIRALSDSSPRVRRAACETLCHLGQETSWVNLVPALKSESRTEAIAARRVLESLPTEQWKAAILDSEDLRVFLNGSTALMIVEPSLESAYQILARASTIMEGYLSDRDFADLLRVVQLALHRGNIDPEKIPVFHDRMLEEFPTSNGTLNRELSRIIGYLGDARVSEHIVAYLANETDSPEDKLQVVLNLESVADEFNDEQRLAIISFLEELKTAPGDTKSNYGLYLTDILSTWSSDIGESRITEVLENGARWPSAALAAFYRLPEKLTEQQVELISEMDRQLKGRTDAAALQARIGCIAVLGRSADDQSMNYLREIWRHEKDRRNDVVMGLAQKPEGQNWPYLVSSLNDLGDDSASLVLTQLATVNQSPKEPRFFRDTITTGFRLRESGARAASRLLNHWTGQEIDEASWRDTLQSWASWFNEKYPDEEPISFEDQEVSGKYSVDQILTYLETTSRQPLTHSGMLAFTKAQCVQCHRFNGQGESMGPDLSTLARRFSKRETLRSILHPSEVISSQYAGKKILTTDGIQYVGLVSEADDGSIVILTDEGKKVNLATDEIDQMADAEVSAMPKGLLDDLSLEEINDLVGYLYSAGGNTATADNTDSGSTR